MELTFQTHPFSFLHCLMNEVHFQEEVSDMIVPDSYPDIDHIADCFADVILRGKECRTGSAMISGGIKAELRIKYHFYAPYAYGLWMQGSSTPVKYPCGLVLDVNCQPTNVL